MRSEGSSRLRRISRRKLHMRVVSVKRALHWSPGQASGSFLTQINCSRCGPCGVVGDATSVVQAQRQIHRVLAGHHTAGSQRTRFPIEIAALRYVSCGCVAIRGSSPFIDSGFDRRRTSHSVAASERESRSSSRRLRSGTRSDDELRDGLFAYLGGWLVPVGLLRIRGELAIGDGSSCHRLVCGRIV